MSLLRQVDSPLVFEMIFLKQITLYCNETLARTLMNYLAMDTEIEVHSEAFSQSLFDIEQGKLKIESRNFVVSRKTNISNSLRAELHIKWSNGLLQASYKRNAIGLAIFILWLILYSMIAIVFVSLLATGRISGSLIPIGIGFISIGFGAMAITYLSLKFGDKDFVYFDKMIVSFFDAEGMVYPSYFFKGADSIPERNAG